MLERVCENKRCFYPGLACDATTCYHDGLRLPGPPDVYEPTPEQQVERPWSVFEAPWATSGRAEQPQERPTVSPQELARALGEALAPVLPRLVRFARLGMARRRASVVRLARRIGLPDLPHLETEDLERLVRFLSGPPRAPQGRGRAHPRLMRLARFLRHGFWAAADGSCSCGACERAGWRAGWR